ncbi:MAG: hypothetical protein ACD_56C00078G0001 [uncultured bacterium]|nr:MAG: hypothetical protein ACD_56C00078G0001 [uncultured bacterium]
MKNKILFSVLIFTAVFGISTFLKFQYARAASDLLGWIWGGSTDSAGNSSGVGWISLSSETPDAGSGVTYGVTLPSGDGNLTGYAWSSSYGWIDFNPQDHCTTGVPDATKQQYKASSCNNPAGNSTIGVSRSGDSLSGWARFVSIAEATASNNSGGWDGWIKMDADPSKNYAVRISSDGKLTGYAWSSEIGALSFESVEGPVVTKITFDQPSPNIFDLSAGEIFVANSKTTNLSWSIVGSDIQSCSTSCTTDTGVTVACPGFSGVNPRVTTSVGNVPVAAYIEKFIITCLDTDGTSTVAQALVQTGCYIGTCSTTAETCSAFAGGFTATNNGDDAVCKRGCVADSDCALRKTNNWREIAP